MRVVIFWAMCHHSLGHEKKALLRGSVPKNGPIDFASKNHFSLNSADGKGLVPKY